MRKHCMVILGFGLLSSLIDTEIAALGEETKPDDKRMVITPGGPRPADKVHTVRPGEHVQVNPDGSSSVVPDAEKSNPRKPDEAEPQ